MVDGESLGSQSGTGHCYSMKNEDIPYHISWLENGEMGKKVTETFEGSTPLQIFLFTTQNFASTLQHILFFFFIQFNPEQSAYS